MTNSIPADSGWYLDEYDAERFWEHVTYRGGTAYHTDPLASASGECWLWNGALTEHQYGRFRVFGSWVAAHRIAYQDFGNKLPDDLFIDHLCRNKSCVNPRHLEAVTHTINVRRGKIGHKTHCPSNHEYSPENTKTVIRKGKPVRYCLICLTASRHRTYLRRKAEGKV